MTLSYNPNRSLELEFTLGGDAVATCIVNAGDEQQRRDPQVAIAEPGRPGVAYVEGPLPPSLQIDVEVEGRSDTNFLFLTELRQSRRLPRFDVASGRVSAGSIDRLSFVAEAVKPRDEMLGDAGGYSYLRAPRHYRVEQHVEEEPSPVLEEQEASDYSVWFGTNRRPIVWQDTIVDFGPERDAQLHVGLCRVTIPKSHEIGSVGSSWLKRVLEGTDDRLTVGAIQVLEQELYWSALAQALAEVPSDERHAVVFLHGFNVKFKDAAIRAAQLGFDLKVSGAMAFYSWPSRGRLRSYLADEASIEASEEFIANYFSTLAIRSGAAKVHIIAHSMGNRGLIRTVDRIAANAAALSGKPFDQIVIAAADVDRDVFERLSAAYQQIANRTTMYVCAKDKAVEASRWLHSYDRAGLTPPVVVVPGVDTVSASNLDLTRLGHGYIGEAKELLADMYDLFRDGKPPSKRFRLAKETAPSGVYWKFLR